MLHFVYKICSVKPNLRGAGKIVVFARVSESQMLCDHVRADPLWISEYGFRIKLEDSHTAFPDSIRPSRNGPDVMDAIAIRY